MSHGDARSIDDIAREAERARANFADTVEQIKTKVGETANDVRERIQPEAIKRDVGNYVRSRGEELIENVTDAARKNPLQAAAVGLSVAYPLLRIARTVPLPIWMVGAGLYLAGSKSGQAAAQKVTEAASDFAVRASERAGELKDELDSRTEGVRRELLEAAKTAQGLVGTQLDRASDVAKDTGSRVAETVSAAGDVAQQFAAAASEKAKALANTARESGSVLVDDGLKRAAELTGRVASSAQQGAKSVTDAMKENPLFAAGIGLAVGGVIAALLPASSAEKGLVGQAGNIARDRIHDLASQGLGVAATLAQAAYGNDDHKVNQRADRDGSNKRNAGAERDDDEVTTAYKLPSDKSR